MKPEDVEKLRAEIDSVLDTLRGMRRALPDPPPPQPTLLEAAEARLDEHRKAWGGWKAEGFIGHPEACHWHEVKGPEGCVCGYIAERERMEER